MINALYYKFSEVSFVLGKVTKTIRLPSLSDQPGYSFKNPPCSTKVSHRFRFIKAVHTINALYYGFSELGFVKRPTHCHFQNI